MADEQQQTRSYPAGVPCWVDTEQPDPRAASRFYTELFGWAFADATPGGARGRYVIASLDGREVAAIGHAEQPPVWTTYIAVADADTVASVVIAAGGTVRAEPHEVDWGGRTATCADPEGAAFRLWQPRQRLGAQVVNAPGTWNFSHLRTHDQSAARTFYQTVFGWSFDEPSEGGAASVRLAGYGEHLAATVDPGIFDRQAFAPPGFADVIAGVQPAGPDERPHWHVTFSVGDRDAGVATAERLGATVLSSSDTPWTRLADIRDPRGAEFTVSEFRPPKKTATAIACSRSAQRSSTFSRPTATRSRPSGHPAGGLDAGASLDQRLDAAETRRVAERAVPRPRSARRRRRRRSSNARTPPAPSGICRRCELVLGVDRAVRGSALSADVAMRGQAPGQARPRSRPGAAGRTWSVRRPRRSSHAGSSMSAPPSRPPHPADAFVQGRRRAS